ncbi:MAG: hypothetical protein MPW15_19995 [Candidatus Manganitrophus sp.]|nr:hypothetical protein [Candidatus Manganitrophus sp.]
MLEDLWGSRRRVMVARPQWRPPVDFYETEEELIVKVEIAGVREEDFEITLYNDTLVIGGGSLLASLRCGAFSRDGGSLRSFSHRRCLLYRISTASR